MLFNVLECTTRQNVTVFGVINVKRDLILTPIHPSLIEQMTAALQDQVAEGTLVVGRSMQKAGE
jgi:hypothetical protein